MTTVAILINRNGEAIGVVGVDIMLNSSKEVHADLLMYNSGAKQLKAEKIIEKLCASRDEL